MGASSRLKGSRGELEVLPLLEKWWKSVEPDCVFARTPGSGGWHHAKAFKAKGDHVARRENGEQSSWPFFVEVKRREQWNWLRVVQGKKSPVDEWWRKTVEQAAEQGSIPMLLFRKNREQWRVMLPGVLVPDLTLLLAQDPVAVERACRHNMKER